ncbi:hypothetical protein ACUNV4_26060 [Granulosicoccus sp. 3-233]|uniref:hypothetical protein n=1 Tax=Granulosicoccus sp. 3-233 TaxID=3417969 RepID=UPI003D32A76D
MNYQSPTASKVAEMLSMVLGVEATAKEGSAPDAAGLDHVAIFLNREDELVASCSCNLSTAAALGCALSMIPPGGAEVMVEDGALSDTASENFYEMMNICSSLLMNDKSAHLRLVEVVVDAGRRMLTDGNAEVAFDVELGKYGKGSLVFNHT